MTAIVSIEHADGRVQVWNVPDTRGWFVHEHMLDNDGAPDIEADDGRVTAADVAHDEGNPFDDEGDYDEPCCMRPENRWNPATWCGCQR